jgi:hypothetical protein
MSLGAGVGGLSGGEDFGAALLAAGFFLGSAISLTLIRPANFATGGGGFFCAFFHFAFCLGTTPQFPCVTEPDLIA